METIIIYIFAPIVSALLLWIGWLIKREIESRDSQKRQQKEYILTLKRTSDFQDLTLEALMTIMDSLKVDLQSNDVQFVSFHNSGIMNGESVEYREKIHDELEKLNAVSEKIKAARQSYTNDIKKTGNEEG